MTWFIVAITPLPISFLMTSTGLTRRRSARSLTEIAGGRTTLRSPFTCGRRTAVARPNWLRAASIARGGSGAAAFRVSLLIFKKFNSSLWLMLSSRASSCAFMTWTTDYDRSRRCRNPALSGYESDGSLCQTKSPAALASSESGPIMARWPGAGAQTGLVTTHCCSRRACRQTTATDVSSNGSRERARRRHNRGHSQHRHDRNTLHHAGVAQVVVEHRARGIHGIGEWVRGSDRAQPVGSKGEREEDPREKDERQRGRGQQRCEGILALEPQGQCVRQ